MSVCQTCTLFIFLNLFFILNPLVPIWENLNQLWPTLTSLRAKRSVKTSPSLRATCPTGRRAKRSNLYSNNRLPACRQTGFSRSSFAMTTEQPSLRAKRSVKTRPSLRAQRSNPSKVNNNRLLRPARAGLAMTPNL